MYVVLENLPVSDISPLRGLKLRALRIYGTRVTDLSVVRGMPLTDLYFGNTPITDLTPVADCPLKILWLEGTKISDVSLLKGKQLQSLNCTDSEIRDISVLRGMPLTYLGLSGLGIEDISVLHGMPLEYLHLAWNPIVDLSPLRGMPLTVLDLSETKVTDLSPLEGMPLNWLSLYGSPVTDISVLRGMPLTELNLAGTDVTDLSLLPDLPLRVLYLGPEKMECDLDVIRAMKSIEKINSAPPAEFWQKFDNAEVVPPPVEPEEDPSGVQGAAPAPVPGSSGVPGAAPGAHPGGTNRPSRAPAGTAETLVQDAAPAPVPGKTTGEGLAAVTAPWCTTLDQADTAWDENRLGEAFRLYQQTLDEMDQDEVTDEDILAYHRKPVVGKRDLVKFVLDRAELPVEKQVELTQKKLKEMNPDYTGKGRLVVRDGKIVEAHLGKCGLTDIRALRGLPLEVLVCRDNSITGLDAVRGMPLKFLDCWNTEIVSLEALAGLPLGRLQCGRTQVADLGPLKETQLTDLNALHAPIRDLSPLRGMSLTHLVLDNTEVRDISSLQGMPLEHLGLGVTQVTDISPLRGMSLKRLVLWGLNIEDFSVLRSLNLTEFTATRSNITDLSVLTGMSLTILGIHGTQVSDLSPLAGMPLTRLDARETDVRDLGALNGMGLRDLNVAYTAVSDLSPVHGAPLSNVSLLGTPVADIAPLADAPLQHLDIRQTAVTDLTSLRGRELRVLYFDPAFVSDGLDAIRQMAALNRINGLAPEEFWRKYDAGEYAAAPIDTEPILNAHADEYRRIVSEAERRTRCRNQAQLHKALAELDFDKPWIHEWQWLDTRAASLHVASDGGFQDAPAVHTHVPSAVIPSRLRRDVVLPKQNPRLWIKVIGASDCYLALVVNGRRMWESSISGREWCSRRFDLTPWAGQKTRLELVNTCGGPNTMWSSEQLYIHDLRIEAGAAPVEDLIALREIPPRPDPDWFEAWEFRNNRQSHHNHGILPVSELVDGHEWVAYTHPVGGVEPCTISGERDIPTENPFLHVVVRPHREDLIKIRVGSKLVHETIVEGERTDDTWPTLNLDLSSWAGTTQQIVIEHHMGERWAFSAAHWADISVRSAKDKPKDLIVPTLLPASDDK